MTNNSYYELLGVAKDARPEEIKTAYRDLVKRYHPDVNPAGNAGVMFRMIQEAYEVIGDPQKRAAYDRPEHQRPQEPSSNSTYEPPQEAYSYTPESSGKDRGSIFVSDMFMISDLWESKFVFLESVLAGLALGIAVHYFFALHFAICLAVGCAGGFLLLLLFHIKIGVWLVSIACSLFWGWCAADITYSASYHNTKMTLIIGISACLLSAGFHIKEATEL